MACSQWKIEEIPSPVTPPQPNALTDAIENAIEDETEKFDDPRLRMEFSAAVGRVMNTAGRAQAAQIANEIAAVGLQRFVACLAHFDNPQATLDAMRIVVRGHKEDGLSIADLAKVHGIRRQNMHKRVIRVARFLGLEYKREKPHRRGHR